MIDRSCIFDSRHPWHATTVPQPAALGKLLFLGPSLIPSGAFGQHHIIQHSFSRFSLNFATIPTTGLLPTGVCKLILLDGLTRLNLHDIQRELMPECRIRIGFSGSEIKRCFHLVSHALERG